MKLHEIRMCSKPLTSVKMISRAAVNSLLGFLESPNSIICKSPIQCYTALSGEGLSARRGQIVSKGCGADGLCEGTIWFPCM